MKSSNWFDFKFEYITGNQYFSRYLVSIILMVFIVPGIWLLSVTVYKRSKSLGWSHVNAIIVSVLFPVFLVLTLVSRNSNEGYSIFQLLLTVIHFVLWFSEGKGIISLDEHARSRILHGNDNGLIIANQEHDMFKKQIYVNKEKIMQSSIENSESNEGGKSDSVNTSFKNKKNSSFEIEPYEF